MHAGTIQSVMQFKKSNGETSIFQWIVWNQFFSDLICKWVSWSVSNHPERANLMKSSKQAKWQISHLLSPCFSHSCTEQFPKLFWRILHFCGSDSWLIKRIKNQESKLMMQGELSDNPAAKTASNLWKPNSKLWPNACFQWQRCLSQCKGFNSCLETAKNWQHQIQMKLLFVWCCNCMSSSVQLHCSITFATNSVFCSFPVLWFFLSQKNCLQQTFACANPPQILGQDNRHWILLFSPVCWFPWCVESGLMVFISFLFTVKLTECWWLLKLRVIIMIDGLSVIRFRCVVQGVPLVKRNPYFFSGLLPTGMGRNPNIWLSTHVKEK